MLGAHYLETDDCDFVANSTHKAIIKLHRLNRLQHNSTDDWAHNLLEATHDLENEKDQLEFLAYLANPGGYKKKDKLWDILENWEKENTDKQILKACQPDSLEDKDLYTRQGYREGSTIWIEQGPIENQDDEKTMDTISE